MSSGSATTTNANDLLVGLGASGAAVTQGATGWTARSTAYGNRTMDRNVTATGGYTATMTQNSNAWVLQLVAFKADPGETTPPTAGSFQNEVLATGFDLPTAVRFLPDGRMLVVELQGRIKVLPPPYAAPDATLFLQLTNVGSAGVQQGLYDIALDPGFTGNHFYYLFYTLGTPNRDRLSRFTANASLTGTVAGSERVLYQDPQDANAEHHGGAVSFGNDGKLYFTTGEHFDAPAAQSLSSPRGKVHRINPDGTVPTDNPFYDGTGPNVDSIWARGLRNPYRAFYDAPSGRLFVGDVGGNDNNTSKEERWTSAPGAPTTAGPTPRARARRRAPARSTPTRTPAATPRSPAASSTTAASTPPPTRAATSSPTTPRTGSGGSPSTPAATSPAPSPSSRPTGRSTGPTATSST
jgi:glucose/arabinose dehydrogenase